MDGRTFLDTARELVGGSTEAHWRSAAGRAYYALLHEGRAALDRWGAQPAPHENIHRFVRHRLLYAAGRDLKNIGTWLDFLASLRNVADYELSGTNYFTSDKRARQAIVDAERGIVLLDQIEADPARRAAAVQALASSYRRP